MRFLSLLMLLTLFHSAPSYAQQQSNGQAPSTNPSAEIDAMNWIRQGNVKLPLSHSTLSIPPDYSIIVEKDAKRLSEIINATKNSELESIAYAPDESLLYIEYFDSGYVTLDDWAQIDTSKMINDIKEGTEASNKERTRKGAGALHVDDWLTKPTLDRNNNQAYWAINAHTDAGVKVVNAIALQLGRNGYTKITWAGDANNFRQSTSLATIMSARSFDSGYRYGDHIESDKIAGYGIAALVGAVTGAKVLKVAAGAGLLVLLKKFFFVPILLAGAAFSWIKRVLSRKTA